MSSTLAKGSSLGMMKILALALADSCGSRIDFDDKDSWSIGDFYVQHDYKPSRYKLYVMYVPPVSSCVVNEMYIMLVFTLTAEFIQ